MSETPVCRPAGRVWLRDIRPGDEAAVGRLLGDWRVVRHMLFPLHTPAMAAELVANAPARRRGETWAELVLAIAWPAAEGEVIGLCGLDVHHPHRSGEAWYLLAPERWGLGLATEALAGLLAIGFEEWQLHRVWATCLPENPASARLLEKVGFRREGYQRRNLPIHGQWRDSFLYALLGEEWVARDPSAAWSG